MTHPHPHPGSNDAAAHHQHGDHDHDLGHDHDHTRLGPLGWAQRLLRPHSHDAADAIDNAMAASEDGVRAVKVSLVVLMATGLLQVAVVLVTGSVALLADTVHNFSDALTSIPLWLAFVVGRRAATSSYTFGYRRAEDLAGLFIVGMIALSGLVAVVESVHRLFQPREVDHLWLLVAAGFIGFLGNEAVAIYRIRIGKRIGSAALVADGYHARTDGLTSLAVIVGAIGVALGYPMADPVIGLMIAAAIMVVLRDAARSVFRRLMDGVDPGTAERMMETALRVPGVAEVGTVRARWIGHRLYAGVTIAVDGGLSVRQGHECAELVRHELFHAFAHLHEVDVHVDPHSGDGDDAHVLTSHHTEQIMSVTPRARVDAHVHTGGDLKAALAKERAVAFRDLLEALPALTDAPLRVLNLGAGAGTFAALVLERFPQATAELFDISEPMENDGRDLLSEFSARFGFHEWDMSAGPIPSQLRDGAPFDVVVSAGAIHHLDTDRKAWLVSQCHALTRPGGIFANYDLYRDAHATFGPDEAHSAGCATLDEASRHLDEAGYLSVEILSRAPRPTGRTELALMVARA